MAKKSPDLEPMSVDELWALQLGITAILTRRISDKKTNLNGSCFSSRQEARRTGAFRVNGAHTRRYIRIEIQRNRPRPGRAVGSSHVG